jgi:hypothetical protein
MPNKLDTWRKTLQTGSLFTEVNSVSVNYAIRFSGPVTALTARRVRYGVGPDLICQSGPSPGIKTHSSPAAFPTTLSLPFVPFPPLSHLPAPPPSCLRPRRAPPTPLPGRQFPQNRYDAASGKMPHRDKIQVRPFIPRCAALDPAPIRNPPNDFKLSYLFLACCLPATAWTGIG